ncbi:putative ribonuclease p/mrp subunit [Phyllosticta capitalensis]|uniref:Ribonuclease p/mrp subunit n=1 Tax=Phyllosticta capitalensis TaxID=121624 RepID=A0ABR1YLD6_9PEZI
MATSTGLGGALSDPLNATTDIVFVHGLGGDRVRTWTAVPSEDNPEAVFWPKELLPEVCKAARILSFGYDASFAQFWPGQDVPVETTIDDHSTSLFQNLAGLRSETSSTKRPIIFVAHSLGGLVVANALARQNADAASQAIGNATKGAIFLGTPFEGSDLAKLGKIGVQIASLFSSTNEHKLKDLQRRSQKVTEITRGFLKYLRVRDQSESRNFLDVACFFEEYQTRVGPLRQKIGLVVDKESAVIPGIDGQPIPASHSNMCKFGFVEHAGFRSVSAKLCQWITALKSPSSAEADQLKKSAINISAVIENNPNNQGVIMGGFNVTKENGVSAIGSQTYYYGSRLDGPSK